MNEPPAHNESPEDFLKRQREILRPDEGNQQSAPKPDSPDPPPTKPVDMMKPPDQLEATPSLTEEENEQSEKPNRKLVTGTFIFMLLLFIGVTSAISTAWAQSFLGGLNLPSLLFLMSAIFMVQIGAAFILGAFLIFKVPYDSVSFGVGPKIYSNGGVCFRSIPIGGFVKQLDEHPIDSLPFTKAAAISLMPHFTMLLVSAALLGVQVISQIPATLLVLIKGCWNYDLAQNTIDAGLSIFEENPFKGYLITMLAMSITNLLPIPVMGGGFFYRYFLPERKQEWLTTLFALPLFVFGATYLLIWIF